MSNFKICVSYSLKFGKPFALILTGVTFKYLYISLRGLSPSTDVLNSLLQKVYYTEFNVVLMPAILICHGLFLIYWILHTINLLAPELFF